MQFRQTHLTLVKGLALPNVWNLVQIPLKVLSWKNEMIGDSVIFEEKDNGQFESVSVNSVIISIAAVPSTKGKYSVNKEEYEQLVLSLD